MNERAFQADVRAVCERIVNGMSRAREIVAEVTPGGGKSTIPMIVCAHLIPARAEKLCWIVPRVSLAQQAAEDYARAGLRSLCGQRGELRRSTNDVDPSRGHVGFVTTYQAVVENPRAVLAEFQRDRRYVLVLDEPHHIREDSPSQRALAPILERAAYVVKMSGTFERGDGKAIAFMEEHYQPEHGGARLVLEGSEETAVVRYGRRDALAERAIKRLSFYHLDGQFQWIDRGGDARSLESLRDADRHDSAEAIFTALHTDYARDLLVKTVGAWQEHRRINPRAKLLVVAPNIRRAKVYLRRLRELGVERVDIATSDDSAAALEAIRRFKRPPDDAGALDALVTVAMAYEGLDVPAITHIACLTHIRSRPWIWQMLARGSRVDYGAGPWDGQSCVVFGPDDPPLNEIMRAILAEQAPFVREPGTGPPPPGPGDGQRHDLVPLAGVGTNGWARDMAEGVLLGSDRVAQLEEICRSLGISYGGDPFRIEQLIRRAAEQPAPRPVPAAGVTTPREREESLRVSIEERTRGLDYEQELAPGSWNRRIVQRFGKSRERMSEAELRAVWAYLKTVEDDGDGAG